MFINLSLSLGLYEERKGCTSSFSSEIYNASIEAFCSWMRTHILHQMSKSKMSISKKINFIRSSQVQGYRLQPLRVTQQVLRQTTELCAPERGVLTHLHKKLAQHNRSLASYWLFDHVAYCGSSWAGHSGMTNLVSTWHLATTSNS